MLKNREKTYVNRKEFNSNRFIAIRLATRTSAEKVKDAKDHDILNNLLHIWLLHIPNFLDIFLTINLSNTDFL